MRANAPEILDQGMGRNTNGVAAATIAHPIATMGEVFPDGGMIEVIRANPHTPPELWLWDGEKQTSGARVSYKGQQYEPARIDRTLLHHLMLPTACCEHRSTGELLNEIGRVIANFVGLDEKCTDIAARVVLGSALVDSMRIAPALVIVGPDVDRGNQFMTVLHCLCRHALPLTGVTPASFRSLPSGVRFSFLLSQTTVSPTLQKLLEDASKRDQKIPYRGGLLDLFGVQVIHSDPVLAGDSRPRRSIEISMIPTGGKLPTFDPDLQQRIAHEFQPKLLDFRRANLSAACQLQFDSSKFDFELRELARNLAATTPDNVELQAKLLELLQDEGSESRSRRWTELGSVACEAILVAHKETPGDFIYIGDLAMIAQGILTYRGEAEAEVSPAVFGKTLRTLGIATGVRDARGIKLRLTDSLAARARQLAHDLGSPEITNEGQTNVVRHGEETQ